MPDSITQETIRQIEPLSADEPVGAAAQKVIEAKLPGLPAVEKDGSYAGIFGEREFMAALFPGYVGELGSSAMIRKPIGVSWLVFVMPALMLRTWPGSQLIPSEENV